jgi:N-methyl-L-proline demethylase
LKNRIMTTAHQPAFPGHGIPKGCYRAYHVEHAKGSNALPMTDGSASTSRDGRPAFNDVLAHKDEIVALARDLADASSSFGLATPSRPGKTHAAIHDALLLMKDV